MKKYLKLEKKKKEIRISISQNTWKVLTPAQADVRHWRDLTE